MSIRLLSLPLLALLAAPLAAQEATDPLAEEHAAEQAPAGEAGAPADLSMGTPVEGAPAEPQVGEPYIREEFGDWSLRCLRAQEGPDPCQLYQLLYDAEGNTVAEISLFPLPEGASGEAVAGATIVAPLETLLTEGLTLSVDGTAERRYPFTFCTRAGCVSRVGFTAEEVNQFKRGNAARLSIVPAAAPDQTVDLTISLSGFTAGYDTTEAVPEPAQ